MSYLGRSAKLSLKAQEKVSFLATAGQTVKTGLSYTPSFVEVYVNGVLLTDTTDFTATNGNSVTFTVALLLNDEVTVISLKTFTVADHYTKSDADTLLAAKSPIASPSFTGTVTADGLISSGDTLIGTTQAFNALNGRGNLVVGSGAGNEGITIYTGSTGSSGLVFADGIVGSQAYTGQISYEHSVDAMTFAVNGGTERMRIDSSGNVGVGTASPSSWAKLNVAGTGGAQTGATQALHVSSPSATANEGVGIRLNAASGSHEAVGIIGMVNNASGNFGAMTFHTYSGGSYITERMRINSAGIVTKPYQPAFHAMSGVEINTTSSTGAFIVEFNSALVNTGGHYSTTNDRFTAPVAGVYKFAVGFMTSAGRQNRFGFFKNGGIQGNVGYAGPRIYQRTTYELCITLAVNDYVDFRTNINSGVEGCVHADYRYFTGYLIG